MPPSREGLSEKNRQENYRDFVNCGAAQCIKIKQFSESAFQHSNHLLSRAASVALFFCFARKGAKGQVFGGFIEKKKQLKELP